MAQRGKGTNVSWTHMGKTMMVVTNEHKIIRKLDKYAEDEESNWTRHPDDENGNAVYTADKSMITLRRKKRTMSEERKEELADQLEYARAQKG